MKPTFVARKHTPDKADMLWHIVFASGHEDVKEVLSANGQQLDSVLAGHSGRALGAMEKCKFLPMNIQVMFIIKKHLIAMDL